MCETWFSQDIGNAELSFNGAYQVLRCSGGVCILAKVDLNITEVFRSVPDEFLAVDIVSDLHIIRLDCTYVTYSGSSNTRIDRISGTCSHIDSIANTDSPLLIVGDFNMPRIS